MSSSVVAITNAGKTVFAQAISGTKIQIASAHFGSDIITDYTQDQLQALSEVVTGGKPVSQYSSDSSVISYLFPQVDEVQIRVNLGTTIGDFDIGNWGLFDSNGNLLFIIGLAGIDHKSKTSSTQVGDNRIYSLNIPITSDISDAIDFTVLSLDAAALPEVTTEENLPSAEASTYPVFHVQNYADTSVPCLASRVSGTWYYYLPLSSILSSNNTWTGVNTFNNSLTSTNSSPIGSGASDGSKFYILKRAKATDGSDYGTLVLKETTNSYHEWHFLPSGDILDPANHAFLRTYGINTGDLALTQIASTANGASFTDSSGASKQLYSSTFLDNRWSKYINQPVLTTSSPTFSSITSTQNITSKGTIYTDNLKSLSSGKVTIDNLYVSGTLTSIGNTSLANGTYTVNTGGYAQLYKQDSPAANGIMDFYSNYSSTKNNVARISNDGSVLIYGGGRFWENGHNLLATYTNINTDRALVQSCGNTAGTYVYFKDTDGRGYYTPTTAWVLAGGYTISNQVNFNSGITVNYARTMSNGTGTINSGDYVWGPGVNVYGYGALQATLQVTDVNGGGDWSRIGAHLYVLDYSGGNQKDWYFTTAGRVRDPQGNYMDALPKGAIIMWYGSTSTIPTGWVLCDGNNGTPDLRDKVVVGAGIQALGYVAGNWTTTANTASAGGHNHFTNTLGHTLTVDEMPSHQHTYSWKGITSEGHGTDTMGSGGTVSDWSGGNGTSYTGGNQAHTHGITWDGDHLHSLTVSTQQPSFYVYFIMKTGS